MAKKHYLEKENTDSLPNNFSLYEFGTGKLLKAIPRVIDPTEVPKEVQQEVGSPPVVEKIIEKIVKIKLDQSNSPANQEALDARQRELHEELIEAIRGLKLSVDLPEHERLESILNRPGATTSPVMGFKIKKIVRDANQNITEGTEFEVIR